ncbi:Zn-dependent hydrolase, partial [Paracoccus sp. (in: a-proteobacteria)]|uniref:Zn-dependent hydrolase n=1 Tax=Paracoccus sp. TaxID=267 RepID=UPI0026E0D310
GSGIWAGVYSRAYGDSRTDAGGDSFGASLDRIGWRGDAKAGSVRFGAMFELHIEQGPILEAEGRQIGVVQGVQGMRWFDLSLTGTAAHTGSTPMHLRRNALVGMARVIGGIDRIARGHKDAVGTIGFLEVSPNSHNVIPGEVRATIDLRHPEDAVLDRMEQEVAALVAETAQADGLEHRLDPISRTAPVAFDPECIASVRAGARAAGLSTRDMISGAGHDAVHAAAVAPTTMIFVPCKGGLSHNPAESTLPEECAAGAQVLLEAVLDYDRRRAERRKEAAA